MDFLPVLEIMQMCGRAGRITYDHEGFGILLPKDKAEATYAWDNYINGDPEDITSKLGVEPVLRTHVLALIASGVTPTRKQLIEFFLKTFYAYQYEDQENLERMLGRILRMLREFKFIESSEDENVFKPATTLLHEQNEQLKPTRIGMRVSELYIDPLTAHRIITSLQRVHAIEHFPLLQLIARTQEMAPLLGIRKNEYEAIAELLVKKEHTFLEPPPPEWDIEYEDYLKSIKTALVFNHWCEEWGEDRLLDVYGITPGELRSRLTNADWLLYAVHELALLLGKKDNLNDIRKSRLRVKYGIREELLPLVKLKGVGRVRARMLYRNGLKTLDALRKAPLSTLERIVGTKTAKDIKDQL
jgi:helicase